jgi:hypothetical protein
MSYESDAWSCEGEGSACPGWVGAVPLTGLDRGEYSVKVTATDVLGGSVDAQAQFLHDDRPVLTVEAPLPWTVARPEIYVKASCSDDSPGGCSVSVSGPYGPVLASGPSIDQNVSLTYTDSSQTATSTLTFSVTDSVGNSTTQQIVVCVLLGNQVSEVDTVGGRILDVQADRILFLDESGASPVLAVHDRASGTDTAVPSAPDGIVQYGFLTPEGVIEYESFSSAPYSKLYEWRDSALEDLGKFNPSYPLLVAGSHAVWLSPNDLVHRNLDSGVTETVAKYYLDGSNGVGGYNLASNGDVVYGFTADFMVPVQIYRYRGGNAIQIAATGLLYWNGGPLTDGINVVYCKNHGVTQDFVISMYGESGETALSILGYQPSPGSSYQVNNGWVAFTKPGPSGVIQVWTRSPTGELQQLSPFISSSSIVALSPTGEVIWSNSGNRYLSKPGQDAEAFATSLSTPVWIGDRWFVFAGRSLFEVLPPAS